MRTTLFPAAIAIVLGSGAAAQSDYTVTEIGLLPGAFSAVPWDLNAHGAAVGYSQGPTDDTRAWLFRPGVGIEELPPPPGFTNNQARAITDSGAVVGFARPEFGAPATGWIWQDGVYTLLPPADFTTNIQPSRVNEHLEIVGGPAAFFWSAATGYIDLPLNAAGDINDAGVVSGRSSFIEPCDGSLARWTLAGGLECLGTLPHPFDDGAIGERINESNDMAGYANETVPGPDAWEAFLFTDDAGFVAISPTPLARSKAHALNDLRHVVGGESGITDPATVDAWLWTPDEGKRYINDLASAPGFSSFYFAIDINNAGQILMIGNVDPGSGRRPVILTPRAAGDVNADGAVDLQDLLMLLAQWGPCPAPPADCADTDGDGVIGLPDLLTLLSQWS